jgi:hypothetical protein
MELKISKNIKLHEQYTNNINDIEEYFEAEWDGKRCVIETYTDGDWGFTIVGPGNKMESFDFSPNDFNLSQDDTTKAWKATHPLYNDLIPGHGTTKGIALWSCYAKMSAVLEYNLGCVALEESQNKNTAQETIELNFDAMGG